MTHEWHYLTDLTGDREFVVTQVRLKVGGVAIDGEFELPPLTGLRYEDQVFVGEFVRSHGSIKQMEKAFGVSYPTVKNRLNRIAAQLHLGVVELESAGGGMAGVPSPPAGTARSTSADAKETLDLLEAGEITPAEAAERLRG